MRPDSEKLTVARELRSWRQLAQDESSSIKRHGTERGALRVSPLCCSGRSPHNVASASGEKRYALDVRILAGQQVAVVDAACSFFTPPTNSSSPSLSPSQPRPGPPPPPVFSPLPRLEELVEGVVSSLASSTMTLEENEENARRTVLFSMGRGLRCSESLARKAIRALHEAVMERLVDG